MNHLWFWMPQHLSLSVFQCVYMSYVSVKVFTSLCLEECDGGCQRCVFCLLWSSAFPPPQITKSVNTQRERERLDTCSISWLTPPPSSISLHCWPGDGAITHYFILLFISYPPLSWVLQSDNFGPFIPHFCGFPSAASPCYIWSLIFWAAGCWGLPSVDSSHTHPSSCSGHLWKTQNTHALELMG